jgi:hypothetical protein
MCIFLCHGSYDVSSRVVTGVHRVGVFGSVDVPCFMFLILFTILLVLSNPSTSRILLAHSLSLRFFSRENTMVNELNPFFARVLFYISRMAFRGWPLGW